MTSTMEQCDSKPLGPLPSTLEMFDTFKTVPEEEKDSDEESFHLPLLGCDDELDNGKLSSRPGSSLENEDEILNKFDTSPVNEFDNKIEDDVILNDPTTDDPECVQNDKIKQELNNEESKHEFDNEDIKIELHEEDLKKELRDDVKKELPSKEIKQESPNAEVVNSNKDNKDEDLVKDNDNIAPDNDTTESKDDTQLPIDDLASRTKENNDDVNLETEGRGSLTLEDFEDMGIEGEPSDDDHVEEENELEDPAKSPDPSNPKESSNENNVEAPTTEESKEPSDKVVEQPKEIDDTNKAMNVEDTNKTMDIEDTNKAMDIDDTNKALDIEDTNKAMDIEDTNKAVDIEDTNKANSPMDIEESEDTSGDREDNLSKLDGDSKKSASMEDLLDISVIRDADEDNASAIDGDAENPSSEKSDNDEHEEDKQGDTEEEETDPLNGDRDEPIEFDDNTSSCDQDNGSTINLVNELSTDSEARENDESDGDSQNAPNSALKENLVSESPVILEDNNQDKEMKEASVETQESSEQTYTGEIGPAVLVTTPSSVNVEKESPLTNNKRPLSEEDDPVEAKKLRLSTETQPKETPQKKSKIETLLDFQTFMKKPNLGLQKLTRSGLEQFCLQKICESVLHKTELGELHQTIRKLEMIIDNNRKDIQQLSKQARDLDIVNKRLMSELRANHGTQKPLVPLKITRSVGLQVKLNVGLEPSPRRKPVQNLSRTPVSNNTPNRARTVTPNGNSVVRQVIQGASTSPRKPAQAPILTQALQNRAAAGGTPSPVSNNKRLNQMRTKTSENSKPSAPGVIDLTDEDERITKTPANNLPQKNMPNKTKTMNKSIQNKNATLKANNVQKTTVMNQMKAGAKPRAAAGLPQGIRLTTQMKNGLTLPAGVVTSTASGATQLMYVVQPPGNSPSGGPQKAVLVNFQPTNGVLTSTINGSSVSVIPAKTTNSMQQLKSIQNTRKHPAPLPSTPPAIVNPSLKPLLPKPHLSIRKTDTGIILQWRMPYNLDIYEGIASYQLFAYQETNAPPSTDMWRKVGDVKALALPMACTLTQFADKNKYYFAVRSVDVHKRIGAFSDPEEISL